MKEVVTKNSEETRKLGKELAKTLKGGEIICLEGDLGSGKTTFSQGLLEGLRAEKPYTSPTFVVMKQYHVVQNMKHEKQKSFYDTRSMICDVYHIDTYRVNSEDILDLGWDELIGDKKNIIIMEWPERVKDIIPEKCLKINFKWIDEGKRKIIYQNN